MIAYVKGRLVTIQEESVILDVNGIGYEIICPNPFAYQRDMQQEVLIRTYHHVREDIQCLFGFRDEDEKLLFTKLISVSGIGPKSAVAILGAVQVPDFITAIETEDEKYLTQFPGVGKKTARQIILDLKGKLTNLFTLSRSENHESLVTANAENITEVQEALIALGYSRAEINPIIPELKKSESTKTEELVKVALGLLVK